MIYSDLHKPGNEQAKRLNQIRAAQSSYLANAELPPVTLPKLKFLEENTDDNLVS